MNPATPLVVIPVYGDDTRLAAVLADIRELEVPTLVINDGQGEALSLTLRQSNQAFLDLGRNRGVGAATKAGLSWAIQQGYTGAVTVDADRAHDKVSVATVLAHAKRMPRRPVLTNRFGATTRAYVPEEKLAANGFACELVAAAIRKRLPDVACGLRYYPASTSLEEASDGFDFIPDTLMSLVSVGAHILDVFVNYQGNGPWLTGNLELTQLLRWADRHTKAGFTKEVLASLLSDARLEREHTISIGGRTWSFTPVPTREAWLIAGPPPYDESRSESSRTPDLSRPSIGIIPDGGRRWARRENVSLVDAYRRSLFSVSDALLDENLGDCAIYCLSAANLRRNASELLALFTALRETAARLSRNGLRPIVWGDVSLLPVDLQAWARKVNLTSASMSGPLTLLVTAYTPSWQAMLFSRRGQPWDLGLSVEILDRVRVMRLAVIMRSGGAFTLSDFLPEASSYAVLSVRNELFNDLNLPVWLENEIKGLARAKYGE